MPRFTRGTGASDTGAPIAAVPDDFTLEQLLAAVDETEVATALSWLYAAIESGEVEPLVDAYPIQYRFVAARADHPSGAAA